MNFLAKIKRLEQEVAAQRALLEELRASAAQLMARAEQLEAAQKPARQARQPHAKKA